MLKIININSNKIDQKTINQAINHLCSGGLIIYPTDTSYGLGALYSNRKSMENIYQLKGREMTKRLSVAIPNMKWAKSSLQISEEQERILRQYLPGKFTFILKKKNTDDTLGIRIPNSNFIRALTNTLNEPITATSANISGQNDCFSVDELNKGILKRKTAKDLDILVLDAGHLKMGERSTVVDLTSGSTNIVRQGSGTL